jgi:tetratricopeptide (TPR) repeat protein/WD40 repeat protein
MSSTWEVDSAKWRGPDYRDVRLRDYPLSLAKLGRREELTKLVCSLSFLDQKLRRFGLDSVIDDVDNCVRLATGDEVDALRALADALRLARVGLAKDPLQLAAQLSGRLMEATNPLLGMLVGEASESAAKSSLLPKTPALTQGHRPSLDTLAFDAKFEDMAVSHDGSFIVTTSKDGRVSVWSLPLRADSRLITFKVPHLTAMALSAKGDFIFTGNESGELQKWDRITGFCEASLATGGEYVAAIRPVGPSFIAATLRQDDICVVDLHTFKLHGLFQADVPQTLCGISDRRLLVGTIDGFVDQFDPQTGIRTAVLGWHGPFREQRMTKQELFMRMMTLNPMFMASSADEIEPLQFESEVDKINASEAHKRQLLKEMREDPAKYAVNSVSLDAAGKAIAFSCAGETELAVLDLDNNRVLRRFRTNFSQAMNCCTLSTAANLAAAGSYDGSIRLWYLATGEALGILEQGAASLVALHFVAQTSALVAAFSNGQLKIWHHPETMVRGSDANSRSSIGVISPLYGFAYIVAGSAISSWSPKTQAQLARRSLPGTRAVHEVTPDGRRAVSFNDHSISIFDVGTAWPLRSLPVESVNIGPPKGMALAKIQHVAVTSDLERIVTFRYGDLVPATMGNHSLLELRDATGKVSRVLDGRAGWIDELAVSPDGRSLVTVGRRKLELDRRLDRDVSAMELRLWDLTTGECTWRIEDAGLSTAAFGDEGRQLWFRTGGLLKRCIAGPEARPETVAEIPNPWKSFRIEGSLIVAFAVNTIEVWDPATAARVGALTLDAEVTAARIVDNLLIAGDRQGSLHFLASNVLARAEFPADNPHIEAPYLQKLDAAALSNSQGNGIVAVGLWLELARAPQAGPELRLAIAEQLERLGYSRENQSIGLAIAADGDVDFSLRLKAVEALPTTAWAALAKMLALRCDDAALAEPASPDRRLLLSLLERMIEAGSDALAVVATDSTIPPISRAVLSHALGRRDPQRAAGILREIASTGTIPARTVALEGLRHLTLLANWIDSATDSIKHTEMDAGARWAICRMLLLRLKMDSAVLFAEKGRVYWHELGLLDSYTELNNRAMALMSANLADRALAILDIGARIFPRDARLHLNRAGIFMREKKWAGAIEEASRCLALEPDNEKALNFRAYARIELEEFELALEDCNQALAIKPGEFANLRNRSGCYRALGRIEEADADSAAADRARQSEGDGVESAFEPSNRPSRYDAHEEPLTDELRTRAAEFLRLTGLADEASAFLSRIAKDTTLLQQFRRIAIDALRNIGAASALEQFLRDSELDGELRIEAAGRLLKMQDSEHRGFFGRSRFKDARTFLNKVVTNPNADMQFRYLAAHELTDVLDAAETEDLARSIPDLDSVRDGAPEGLGVAIILIKSIGAHGHLDRLEALASSRRENGWLRELASQCIGVFQSRERARQLSEAHLAEKPRDKVLIRSIERALDTYRTPDDAGKFSPDRNIEEGFNAFLAAQTSEEVVQLSRKYFFFTYPDFITQVERYTARHPPKSSADLLMSKIEALKSLPRDMAQEAFREFAHSDSPEEMRVAAENFPILRNPHFQTRIESSVAESVAIPDHPAFRKRMEWLRALPQDKWQAALEDFIQAPATKDLEELIGRYPFIRSERFREMARHVHVAGAPTGYVESKLKWLEQQGQDPADVLYLEAIEALQGGAPEEVLEKLGRLRTVNPEGHTDLLAGAAYLDGGQYDKAIECLGRAVERNPSSLGYERRGKAHFILHRFIEAVEDFTRALAIDSDYGDALVGRGLAYYQLGNSLAASQDLERALQLRPTDESIAYPLTVAYLKLGEVQRARNIIQGFAYWSDNFRDHAQSLLQAIQPGGEGGRRPEDAALQALYIVETAEDIEEVVQQNPIFWDPGFQAAAEQHIRSVPEEPVRSRLESQFQRVLQIVRNPGQLAFNDFMAAEDQEAMGKAIREHELLRVPEFIDHLRQLSSQSDVHFAQRVQRQLELYRGIS